MRDFRKQKKRMTLTILAIAWGTISIMLLLAFGEGFKARCRRNQRGLGEGICNSVGRANLDSLSRDEAKGGRFVLLPMTSSISSRGCRS